MTTKTATTAGPKKIAASKRTRISTPWGDATLVEEARVPQSVGEKKFTTLFQLLESSGGERLVRITYTSDGVARRGPVTLRVRDVKRLQAALEGRRALAAALGFGTSGSEA